MRTTSGAVIQNPIFANQRYIKTPEKYLLSGV
ncbi:hypothetical protein F0726_02604 [Acidithiobacillus caldus]|nr:hypothetical protein F0726_02604 [Acidithiobacillus caldus]